jgi:hypothetical protein
MNITNKTVITNVSIMTNMHADRSIAKKIAVTGCRHTLNVTPDNKNVQNVQQNINKIFTELHKHTLNNTVISNGVETV